MERGSARASWALAAAAAVLLLAAARLGPPAPRPAGAPAAEFSAARAHALLIRLVRLAGDRTPHPTGSAAAARIRAELLASLRGLGLPAREEPGFACRPDGVCATVHNVVAELPGRDPTAAVLLAAHYDSVPAGPGAADDLAGVAAALECARALGARPRPLHSILLLLDEGEESGLLGAGAFLEASADAPRVRTTVNLEARGTSGPSLLFETGRPNGWLIAAFARAARHPRTSSLLPVLAERLTHDTDLRVFARRGVAGLNFGFAGDPARYHTPLDDLPNLSLASLQHQGENALAAVGSLADADLSQPHTGERVFFDLLGLHLVGWPAPWGPNLGILSVLLLAATTLLSRRCGEASFGSAALGSLAFAGSAFLASIAGLVLWKALLVAGALRAVWPAHGLPGVAAFWLAALAAAILSAAVFRRAAFLGLWHGVWLAWSLLGLSTAMVFPAASYLFLVPALAAGVAGLALLRRGRSPALAAVLPAAVAGVLWFPLLILLYDGMGTGSFRALGAVAGVLWTALLPFAAAASPAWRRAVAGTALAAVLALAAAAVWLPPFSSQSPYALNVVYYQDAGTGAARWLVESSLPPPDEMRRAAALSGPAPPFPWSAPAYAAPAPAAGLAAPGLAVESDVVVDGKRQLRLRLRSMRGAPAAFVRVPDSAGLEWATIGGRPVSPGIVRGSGYASLGVLTLGPEGIEIGVTLGSTVRQDWYVEDRSPGVPPQGSLLVRARPPWAVPSFEGDTTRVTRKVTI